jgi:hypothetical protein
MVAGEYIFNTADKEIMEIQDGTLEVLLPNSNQWQAIKGGESSGVPATKLTVKINTPTDYCCSFVKWLVAHMSGIAMPFPTYSLIAVQIIQPKGGLRRAKTYMANHKLIKLRG